MHCDQVDRGQQVACTMPARQIAQGITADNKKILAVLTALLQGRDRLHRVRGRGQVGLEAGTAHSPALSGLAQGCLEHGHTVGKGAARLLLVRRLQCGDKQHPVQPAAVEYVPCQFQVA